MLAPLVALASTLLSYGLLFIIFLWLLKELTMGIYLGKERLDGELVVITGANCGIGLETAREVARRGATLVIGCRSKTRGEAAVADIIKTTKNSRVEMLELDLLSLNSVRKFAEEVAARPEPLHLLINNAGMVDGEGFKSWGAGKSHLSDDGLEIVTQTNHLSHFLLTNLLKEKLASAGSARVINVSSSAIMDRKCKLDTNNINYETDSSPAALKMNYHNSKLMNVMFSQELSRRWRDLGVSSFSNHPGLVRTEVFRNFSPGMQRLVGIFSHLLGKDNWQGAQTTLHLALSPGLEAQAGSFFGDCRNWDCYLRTAQADPLAAHQLWERSAQLVHL